MVIRSVSEIGCGLNDHRAKITRLLSDPAVQTIVVEHRDRLARFGSESIEAALAACGRKLVVVDETEFRHPQFKKKGKHDSFRADNGADKDHPNAVEVDDKRVKLPVIGWVKMRESLRFVGKIKSAVVSRTADRWFVSLTVEIEHTPPNRENQAVVGVDLGIKALATLSDDKPPVENTKALTRNRKKQKLLAHSLSHK